MFLSSRPEYSSSGASASVTRNSKVAPSSADNSSDKKLQAGVLEARVSLGAGQVIQAADLLRRKTETNGHAYNPITGPFNDQSELVGRVVVQEIHAGTVITGMHLAALTPVQQQNALRKFWTRCC